MLIQYYKPEELFTFYSTSNPELAYFLKELAKENDGIIVINEEILELIKFDKLDGKKSTDDFIKAVESNEQYQKTQFLILDIRGTK